jgi:hypothetical protein
MRNLAIDICLAVTAIMLSGCAPGSGKGLDENGRPIGESGPIMPLTAEFASIQENVFTPTCAVPGCHIGAAAPQGLRLDEANSFALLAGIASAEVPALLRVNPNNPDQSYLIQKLEGNAAVGGRMPLSGPPFLPQTTIDVIRQWITDGALPAQGPALAPTVVSVAPADGSAFDTLPTEITVIFSDDMDPSVVNATTVQLLSSGGDGSFADGNELIVNAASIGLSPSNPRLLSLDLTGVPSIPDDYQLRLVGSGATALASVAGLILDGDADGSAGGDFASVFTINPPLATDMTPPTVSVTAPVDGSTVSGPTIIAVDASDNVGVTDVSFAVNGLTLGSDATPPYEIVWDTTLTLDGAAQLTATAMDAAGNIGAATAVNVTVDNACGTDLTPPTVTVIQPVAGNVMGTITVAADASDDMAVTLVTFFADGQPIGVDNSAPYEIAWDTTAVINGAYDLTAQATDGCNTTTSAAVTVNVDNPPFAVVVLSPDDGSVQTDVPAAIIATFSANPAAASVDAVSLVVERSGGDGTFGDGNEASILEPVSVSGNQASMDLSGLLPSFEDTYRVTLRDSITDTAGSPLDGDGDTLPGGDFVATFDMDLTTWTDDVAPVLQVKCAPCHTGGGAGGHNIATNYPDALKPTVGAACAPLNTNVATCALFRIQNGQMPQGEGCIGDPVQDAGDPDCLTQAEQDAIQAWIDDLLPE